MADPASGGADVAVGKEWQQGSPSSTLVESVTWTSIAPQLATLPLIAGADSPLPGIELAAGLDQGLLAQTGVSAESGIQLAAAAYRPPGVVLDWTTIQGSYGDYTFDTFDNNANNGYFLGGGYGYFSGTVTFQPGCLVQFATNASLLIYGGIVCNGSQGSPSYLTSWQDGRFQSPPIQPPYGNPPPAIGDASTALWLYYIPTTVTVEGMSISFATTAIEFNANNNSLTETVSDTALFSCQTGVFDGYNRPNVSIVNSACYQVANQTGSVCEGNPFTGGFSPGVPPGPAAVSCLSAQSPGCRRYPASPPTLVDWWVSNGLGGYNYAGTGLSIWLSLPRLGYIR